MNWNWATRSQKCHLLDCRGASIVIRLVLRPVPFGAPCVQQSGGVAQIVDTRQLMDAAVPLANLLNFGFSLVDMFFFDPGGCWKY